MINAGSNNHLLFATFADFSALHHIITQIIFFDVIH